MMTTCSVSECNSRAFAKGMCQPHYNRQRLYGDPNYERPAKINEPCSVSQCENNAKTRGYCEKHYTRWKRHKSPADLEPRECEICGELFDPPGVRSFVCGKTECVRQKKLRNNRASARNRERKYRTVQCAGCSKTFRTQSPKRKYCGTMCPGREKVKLSPLRRAMLELDYDRIQSLLQQRTEEKEDGCWEWTGTHSQQDYPQVGFSKPIVEGGRATFLAHRLMLEAKVGYSIEGMHAHHTCANRWCINPDHLELTTAAENVGEMMARVSFQARIAALEKALAEVEPGHPLLRQRTIFDDGDPNRGSRG